MLTRRIHSHLVNNNNTDACEQNGFRIIMSFINLFVYIYEIIYCFLCLRLDRTISGVPESKKKKEETINSI